VARRVDVEQLIGPSEVAEILGLNNPGSISVYRRRYSTFPIPAVEKGRCVLWIRAEIEAWSSQRKRS